MIGFLLHAIALHAVQAGMRPDCSYDRAQMMALSQNAFDQDLEGGWRPLAKREGCQLAAADLIRDYRQVHGSEDRILYWHEGQLRALAGQVEAALPLFERARRHDTDVIGWNHYVDATIAFLRRDQPALIAARERLAGMPRPDDFPAADSQGRTTNWPLNLPIVDRFLACPGRSYSDALGGVCGNS